MDLDLRDRLRGAVNQLFGGVQLPPEQVETLEARAVGILDNVHITDQEATDAVMQIVYSAGASNPNHSRLVVHKRWASDEQSRSNFEQRN